MQCNNFDELPSINITNNVKRVTYKVRSIRLNHLHADEIHFNQGSHATVEGHELMLFAFGTKIHHVESRHGVPGSTLFIESL